MMVARNSRVIITADTSSTVTKIALMAMAPFKGALNVGMANEFTIRWS